MAEQNPIPTTVEEKIKAKTEVVPETNVKSEVIMKDIEQVIPEKDAKIEAQIESVAQEKIMEATGAKMEGIEAKVGETNTAELKGEPGLVQEPVTQIQQNVAPTSVSQPEEASGAEPPFKLQEAREKKRYIKMLVYGDFGTGKTTFAGTAQDIPEMQNVINIDAEGGDKVLAERGDIDVITVKTFKNLSKAYEFLQAHCLFRDNLNKVIPSTGFTGFEMLRRSEAYYRGKELKEIKQPKIFNTVMLDSLTEIQKYCMYSLLGIDIEKWRLDAIPTSPEWTEWGKNHEMIRLLVRKFRDLPMHVILICSRAEVQDEYKRMYNRPAMPGKLGNEIQGFMDHVGYYTMETNIETKTLSRIMYFQPSRTYQAKNRFSNFKGIGIKEPTMKDIFDLEILNKSIVAKEINEAQ